MKSDEFTWQAADGLQLYARVWQPESPPVLGVVCLVHGLGEHIGRWSHIAEALTGAGYVLLANDLRGHGKSQGKRGHAVSFDVLLDDIGLLLDQARQRFPLQPRFLYGHSMGGSLFLNYVLRREPQLAGVIVTGSWLRLAFEPPSWKTGLGRLLYNIWPGLLMPNGLNPSELSRDPEIVAAYTQETPLCMIAFRCEWG